MCETASVTGAAYLAAVAQLVGNWRIVEMDLWDRDAIDLVGPAYIELKADGTGRFRFIAVEGCMDVKHADAPLPARAEFTWDGDDDGTPASGRGWVELEPDGSLSGRIFFHLGDDSGFRAVVAGEPG
jgi:hypothetical protein